MVGIEKNAGCGDAEGDEGGGQGDEDAGPAPKQEPQWDDTGDGDGGVGGGEGGELETACDPCAAVFEAVPAGGRGGRRPGASGENAQDIGGKAAQDGGAEHQQKDADDEGALEEPGHEQQEKEKSNDGGEIAPTGEELGQMLDEAAGMGANPGDDGIVEKEGGGAQEGAGEEEDFRISPDDPVRFFEFRIFQRVQIHVQVQVQVHAGALLRRNDWMQGLNSE